MDSNFCDNRRILVVDDAEIARNIESLFLQHAGCIVIEAADGDEAVEKYIEFRPALVILDIIMPHLNGIQALKKIRKIDPASRILICTAADDYRLIDLALREGAAGYIIKPYKGEEFLKKVQDVIGEP